MAELNDWQWAIGAAVLMAALVVGGWLGNREASGITEAENEELEETTSPIPSVEISELSRLRQQQVRDELSRLRQQLEVRDSELSQLRQQLEVRDSELSQLRQQLEARGSELQEAREETELTLLQLHQVQEELERYFLESRNLQQKLDAVQTISPEQEVQLKRIKTRLLELLKTLPASGSRSARTTTNDRVEALVQRQQNALRRFQALQKEC